MFKFFTSNQRKVIPLAILTIFGVLIAVVLISIQKQPGPSDISGLEQGDEIISLRNENSKTYYLGNNKRKIQISVGAVHYKDNYADPNEAWKDIDLTWEGNRITKAPYELTLEGNKITFKDKKTNEVSTIELLNVRPAGIEWRIVPSADGVAFQHIIMEDKKSLVAGVGLVSPTDKMSFEAKFKVTGRALLSTRAFDDEGELVLETKLADGILTEKLTEVKDKRTGQVRAPVGNIRIDPVLTVQSSGKDASMVSGDANGAYGGFTWLQTTYRAGITTHRSVLEFPITWGTDIPTGATLTAAEFDAYYYIYDFTDPSGKQIDVYRMLRPTWVESEATWNIYNTGNSWGSGGAGSSVSDYTTTNAASTTVPASYGWMTWNTLAQVQWAQTNNSNVEFMMKLNDETSSPYDVVFYSKEYAVDTSLRPKLVVTYTVVSVSTLTTDAATSITQTTATLNGNITDLGGENAGGRGFEWGSASGVYTNTTTDYGSHSTGAFTSSLLGLTASQTYYYRAYATNTAGIGYGSEANFATEAVSATAQTVASTCVAPKIFADSLLINGGADSTQSRNVNLAIKADGALYMSVSNDDRFIGSVLEDYQATKSWTLSEGDGQKTVYIKFTSDCGKNSELISDSIQLIETTDATIVGLQNQIDESQTLIKELTKLQETLIQNQNALTLQISELQKQLSQFLITSIPSNYTFTQNLEYGQENIHVKYLQIFLKSQGLEIYPEGVVSGYFDSATEEAVKRFQLAHVIINSSVDYGAGYVGEKTRDKINELLAQ